MTGLFDGRTAVVTGGGRGIGRAVALELATAGARVALVARTAAELAAVAQQITERGGRALTIQADLADLVQVGNVARATRVGLGDPDMLINNAAVAGPNGPCATTDPGRWSEAVAVNLVAPACLTFAMLPPMLRSGWGRIVNVSSGVTADATVMTGANAYVTSKTGLEAHTRNLAAELAGTGVTANVYSPGSVDTAMMTSLRELPRGVLTDELRDWGLAIHADGGLLTAEQSAAALMRYLNSDDNGRVWDADNEP